MFCLQVSLYHCNFFFTLDLSIEHHLNNGIIIISNIQLRIANSLCISVPAAVVWPSFPAKLQQKPDPNSIFSRYDQTWIYRHYRCCTELWWFTIELAFIPSFARVLFPFILQTFNNHREIFSSASTFRCLTQNFFLFFLRSINFFLYNRLNLHVLYFPALKFEKNFRFWQKKLIN